MSDLFDLIELNFNSSNGDNFLTNSNWICQYVATRLFIMNCIAIRLDNWIGDIYDVWCDLSRHFANIKSFYRFILSASAKLVKWNCKLLHWLLTSLNLLCCICYGNETPDVAENAMHRLTFGHILNASVLFKKRLVQTISR